MLPTRVSLSWKTLEMAGSEFAKVTMKVTSRNPTSSSSTDEADVAKKKIIGIIKHSHQRLAALIAT